jgi:hypothetical protein
VVAFWERATGDAATEKQMAARGRWKHNFMSALSLMEGRVSTRFFWSSATFFGWELPASEAGASAQNAPHKYFMKMNGVGEASS